MWPLKIITYRLLSCNHLRARRNASPDDTHGSLPACRLSLFVDVWDGDSLGSSVAPFNAAQRHKLDTFNRLKSNTT